VDDNLSIAKNHVMPHGFFVIGEWLHRCKYSSGPINLKMCVV